MSQEIWIKKGGFGAFNKIADGVLQSDERDSEVALWYVFFYFVMCTQGIITKEYQKRSKNWVSA